MERDSLSRSIVIGQETTVFEVFHLFEGFNLFFLFVDVVIGLRFGEVPCW